MSDNEIEAILRDRQKTHGDWYTNATFSREIKTVVLHAIQLRRTRSYEGFTDNQLEALDMIAHKLGRILAGDAAYEDHWLDIAGYAVLAAKGPPKP